MIKVLVTIEAKDLKSVEQLLHNAGLDLQLQTEDYTKDIPIGIAGTSSEHGKYRLKIISNEDFIIINETYLKQWKSI